MSTSSIPQEILSNTDKLNALYSPVRNENVNPGDRIAKLTFWKQVISTHCVKNSEYTFSLPSLKIQFHLDGRTPQCLEEILKDMIRNSECMPLHKYLETSPNSWPMWFANMLIKKPVSWSFNKLKNSVYGEDLNKTFVHLEVVKTESQKMLSSIPNPYKNETLALEELLEVLSKDFPKLNIENAKLLIHYLVHQSKADFQIQKANEKKSTFLVKIYTSDINPISELDLGIYKLKENEKSLLKKIECLENDVEHLVGKAKFSLKNGHRQLAKTYLRKKHELIKRIDKNASALHNIQIMLEKLQDSQTNSSVLESYKQAALSFKNNSDKMNEDAVYEAMDEIREMLHLHEDITSELSKSLTEEDSSLEQELEALMAETEETPPVTDIEAGMKDLNISFPDIPKDSPNKSAQQVT